MRKLAFALTIAFVFVACNKASDADVDEGIKLWDELWDGYFDALETEKTDADKMFAAGEKFIVDHKDKIAKVNTIFNKRGTEAQIKKLETAINSGVKTMQTRLMAIGEALGASMMAKEGTTQAQVMEAAEKLQAQAEGLFEKIKG